MYPELRQDIQRNLNKDKLRCEICFAEIKDFVIFTTKYTLCSVPCLGRLIAPEQFFRESENT